MDVKVLALRLQTGCCMPPIPAVVVVIVDGEEIIFHVLGEILGCRPVKTPESSPHKILLNPARLHKTLNPKPTLNPKASQWADGLARILVHGWHSTQNIIPIPYWV